MLPPPSVAPLDASSGSRPVSTCGEGRRVAASRLRPRMWSPGDPTGVWQLDGPNRLLHDWGDASTAECSAVQQC